ncbi:collagenase [Streptomyces coffeae]|uniref:microbial collagenase n=1 Tax=Streptomyces coffeae TaxID=621382 RepID=A0ABS1NET4_9ACTN|nr:collagenase [Streptomyces coffeae]MBL1098543.1 collagenase [Streptomyces coffeae]
MTALVICLGLVLVAVNPGQGNAATTAAAPQVKEPKPDSGPAPQAATPRTAADLRDLKAEHEAMATKDPSRRAPLSSDKPAPRKAKGKGPKAACNVSDFTSKTGDALVEQIKKSEVDCVNSLFTVTGQDAKALFREEQMVTVANALRANGSNYPGDNTTSTHQVVLYLRAGYYVQYGHPDDVGPYGPALKSAIQGGLDAFFGSSHAFDVTEANGETLAETVTLIDSAGENVRYLDSVVKRLLKGYDSSYDPIWGMLAAVNNSYRILFRGHYLPEFVSAVESDPSVLTVLRDFAVAHDDLLGTDKAYLTYNAGREMGRFLQHDSLKETVSPLAKELLDRSDLNGRTAALWVGVAEMTNEYAKDKCSFYGTCDLQKRAYEAILKAKHTCGPSLQIVAQQMTDAEFTASCESLLNQDQFFHKVVKDNGPVKDDNNTSIEVNVFNSSTDYQTFAGVIFGIDTNNGGMYLEGDPSKEGNVPHFIAYEQPDGDKFQIWNLNHEYTHYLDGRFDMYGDFAAGQTTPTVMWVEGFAEYISYSYRDVTYDQAIQEAGRNTYPLSTLFDTTYENTNTTRTYPWGYLAVRYLLQSHPQDVDTLLGHYRTGDWAGARAFLTNTIGNRYDADFAAWLSKCSAGDCGSTARAKA